MTLATFMVEAGISIALVFMLFNFCMAMIDSSMDMTNKMIEDIQNNDFLALEKDIQKMDNHMRGLGAISIDYLENFDFKKDKLTEENIQKLKEAIGEYEETGDIEELKKILEEFKEK